MDKERATAPRLTKDTNDALHRGPNQRAIRYLDTATAYDLWSEVYDTDGNFLQALDSIEMETLLPRAISLVQLSSSATATATSALRSAAPQTIKVVDLGCGTGRNTIRCLDFSQITDLVAIDLSPKMLAIAERRCTEKLKTLASTTNSTSHRQPSLSFLTYDMIQTPTPPSVTTSPPADLLISTLVLEHVPLPAFFSTVSKILPPGGILLLTNMHAEMGGISQAGFVDPKTGEKIRPVSYAHSVIDTVTEAEKWGLDVVVEGVEGSTGVGVPGVKEIKMQADLIEKLGVRSEKWIGIDVWFGGIWKKRVEV